MAAPEYVLDAKNILVPCPTATAHDIGDLMYQVAGVQRRASSLSALASEALDQVAFAATFLGIARQARLVGETTTGLASESAIEQEAVITMTSTSQTWEVGDYVGATRNGGAALVNQVVTKVTNPAAAIGRCVRKTYAAATTVQFKLMGRVARELSGAGSAVENVETVAATRVLVAADSGKTIILSHATEFDTALPAPSPGLNFKFIVGAAPSGANYTITTNGTTQNVIFGCISSSDMNAANDAALTDATGVDVISFISAKAKIGDWVELVSDGTNWYVSGCCSIFDAITLA
jgi:hypothetical protein